jgi:hypothetical protein
MGAATPASRRICQLVRLMNQEGLHSTSRLDYIITSFTLPSLTPAWQDPKPARRHRPGPTRARPHVAVPHRPRSHRAIHPRPTLGPIQPNRRPPRPHRPHRAGHRHHHLRAPHRPARPRRQLQRPLRRLENKTATLADSHTPTRTKGVHSGRPAAFIRFRSAITTVLPAVAASARVWPRWCMSKHDSIALEKPIVSRV